MKNWNQLFVRSGWLVKQTEENVFDCRHETEGNKQFLLESLDQAAVPYLWDEKTLVIQSEPISEEEWIQTIDFKQRGVGGYLWFEPGEEEPKVRELDTFICGIVRQLNRLGIYTNGSCDGHGRRSAYVMIVKNDKDIERLIQLLKALGMKRVNVRETAQFYHIPFPLKQTELLDLAEKMSVVEEEWLTQGVEYINEQLFYHLLEQLLSIPGASGKEERVRDFVKERLTPYVDDLSVDRNGNLLAEKTYRSGHGPTILLNAHLDTVEEIEQDRTIIKENGIWSSSWGILGADDRAGVASILHMAEILPQTSFSGKVKFIFTVKEEIGLVGARKVDEYFLWGTDAAIVVDRRGTGDIVTSCGGYLPFCEEAYGQFFEKVAKDEGLFGWKCTPGGSSDTRIWTEHGIQSVNLSAGYHNEHTEDECLDVGACYRTVGLIKAFFEQGKELRTVLNQIRRERVS
ncbi:M20/M25/M40 family metallo-hydrolase [Niallia endozanthoxylica]|uniref:M20/M25/M40 family metallo-hydrolase n=1 Tax=Niallia endozanthoxylica TaxID=2036016 RepID=A0A5J5HPX4_9BACI|nr:M20/M25/M40 family metallo-hydrolase [Niallia endozanthoxylica]KAA9022860.1 M20/M25/M40 family metallo-hydrolase [Niallia endozanthoxylica]